MTYVETSYKLICGDCQKEMWLLPSGSIDLAIVDPPFNVGLNYGNTYRDKRREDDYISWCKDWLTQVIRLLDDEGSLYLFNYPENNALLLSFLKERIFFRRWLTWHFPTNIGHSKRNFTRSQRSILYLTKGEKYVFNKDAIASPYRNPKDKRIIWRVAGGSWGRTPYDMLEFNMVKNVSREKTPHPCQVPLPLLELLIKASSNVGDWVLDPFAGSFSTVEAAYKLRRNSIGIEINNAYYEIGNHRMQRSMLELEPHHINCGKAIRDRGL